MAIIEQDIVENAGLIKEVDMEDMGVILDVIQKDVYTKPIESSVRETFSNSYDAIKERDIAVSILTGKSSIEDHFVVSNDIAANSSRFNPDYYNLKYLSKDPKVYIVYTESIEERDFISIEDFGVGLANGRLHGFTKPGYSSKRLSKKLLGKFGLGNKSPLANNIEYFILESWYNGHYTKFMIYDDFFKGVTPKEGSTLTTIIEGKKLIDGKVTPVKEKIYWTSTDRKNGVKISFDVKKHNRQQFLNAVKDQLMYFKDGLEFSRVRVSGEKVIDSMFAEILLEEETFLISNNARFTVPHILINGVNYGKLLPS